ncbi:transcriptional corepressor LEUNIG_HOMOLOG-like [Lycium barbarum]|uniref:transcriptional corepressor LEUNIG_HOMOLOG-like n=1 Tax=Lycium barbarum TaxID=112863 RepID=UPI00293EE734|nr:transcriptional corepressor LEUNIG_HOMOLOG-like [Lycium barbarum]
MSKKGYHQIREAFSPEVPANQNPFAINFPHESFLQVLWGKFYEAYRSRFPDDPVFAAESFDKVAQTVENVVANNGPANQSYASDHTGAYTSNVMPSPHLIASSAVMGPSGPDDAEAMASGLFSYDEMGEMGGIFPFASVSSYQMPQMPTAPPECNARDYRPGINLGGPARMELNIHAPANALPASQELFDAGNNRSLQQASHQGWPYVMLGDTNQRTPENLQADQQIIAPIGGVMRSSGKQPAVQEQTNQLRLQSSDKSGRKRKLPSSSLARVGKGKAIVGGSVAPAHTQAEREGIAFKEIRKLQTTKSNLLCCHFNSRGELLAAAGQDRKVLIWDLGNNNVVSSEEGHTHHITDIRFRPNSTVFATSSFDRTVNIWDAAKPSNPFENLVGHAGHVMSIDFHPTKSSLLSSCDSNDEIKLWDLYTGDEKFSFKGGNRQVRFQPKLGHFLASSSGNVINIFDVETNSIQTKLQGHIKDVRSICWDFSGNCLASVSEDSARIWYVSEGSCLFELYSHGKNFQSCIFHPGHGQVLVIGSEKSLELWNPIFQRNITWPYSAHDGIISSLANSHWKGTIASVSHDQCIKIWK